MTSTSTLFDRHRVIDVDAHLTEPPDVWTARVSSKWGDRVPHVERLGDKDVWMVNGRPVGAPGAYSMAGFDGTIPEFPDTYADVPASMYDANARVAHLDREGLWAQVLYPNVGGFGSAGFLTLEDPDLMLECVRAYNDFLIDWTSVAPQRLLPVMATPFWDVAACVQEIERSARKGHRAILFCGEPDALGQPVLPSRHWDPVWAVAQETGLSISLHIGGGALGSELFSDPGGMGVKTYFARSSALYFMDNAKRITDLIFGGVCHRFPKLRFVSVESGAGWIPSVLDALDWQWQNGGVRREHPEYDLIPSEYFRRQIYGCFWFERAGIRSALEQYPDNLLYETDFPHPTCMAPGPQSTVAMHPQDYATEALAGLPETTVRGVLHDNAARLYGVD